MLNKDLPYEPAIPHLGLYPKECKSTYNKDTFMPMFIAALFTIAKQWNQPSNPRTDNWVKKMRYTQWSILLNHKEE
jgi:hypothetical protein